MSFNPVAREPPGDAGLQANQTQARDWSKCYSCGRTGHALIHLSKGNIKSFLGVIPHVNMSWIYLYMIKALPVQLYKIVLALHVASILGLQVKLLILV